MSPIGGLDRLTFICMSVWVFIQMAHAKEYCLNGETHVWVPKIVLIAETFDVACRCVSGKGYAGPHVDRVLVDAKPIHSCLISHLG
ncbi:hypothetical protein EDB19DRAFT_1742027 [Suillus lakei]|nr:hypothetical protein EDB19DRAFT_1742027 [Suillus lakei]